MADAGLYTDTEDWNDRRPSLASVAELLDASDPEQEPEMFEDASETLHIASRMDLSTAIDDSVIALNLFLNNKFSEARQRVEPWADRSMYHALCYGTIMYLQATMTFEVRDIQTAVIAVKRSLQVCNRYRRKTSVIGSLTPGMKINYDSYTAEEIHAELCYAECLIERAILSFIQDENLISFVKGSLKIRACHQSYKVCMRILERRRWADTDHKDHFESGVFMGNGMFNLLISLLPGRILKLLEFVGFSGNKNVGLTDLELGSQLEKSIRGPLCTLALLGYHTVVTYVLGTGEGDTNLADKLLTAAARNYPKGALMLFFAGRLQEVKGNIREAIVKFDESIDSQEEWCQYHHLCFWELMWCHSFLSDWLLAMKYAEKLCRDSQWSKAIYTYQKASFLMMCQDQTVETHAHIAYLYSEVPRLKQKIAGKSIPVEKFAVKKALRYVAQNNRLTLPAYEIIYVWNGFNIIGKKEGLLKPIMSTVELTLSEIVQHPDDYIYYHDDYCLALLLKGVCLRHSNMLFQAEQCFQEVCSLEKLLTQDLYLVPYALLEMALLQILSSRWQEARSTLDKARHNYKGYSLETRLHFRIHSASLKLDACESNDKSHQDIAPVSPTSTSRLFFFRRRSSTVPPAGNV